MIDSSGLCKADVKMGNKEVSMGVEQCVPIAFISLSRCPVPWKDIEAVFSLSGADETECRLRLMSCPLQSCR